MSHYDYIIAGAGAAGLSLLIHLIDSGKFTDKKILIADKSPKNENDRTWCFWEEEPGLFEPVVYKSWNKMWFHGSDGRSALHNISPYQYKLIRGIDFYEYCFGIIKKQPNISIQYGTIADIVSSVHETSLTIDGQKISADYIFSSIPSTPVLKKSEYFLWQHFKGWVIQTKNKTFNPSEPVLMDFRTKQHADTRFVYVMPFSESEALVEYTVFSGEILSDREYESALIDYCRNILGLNEDEYSIQSNEFGMIPMTNHAFPLSDNNIIYLGTAAGKTKASSGYTFRFIQKHSKKIVDALHSGQSPIISPTNKKFRFYDSVLLNILSGKKLSGARIFTSLFNSNKMNEVMKFLDNETSLEEDIKIIGSLPKSKFVSAAVSHFLK